MKKFSLTLVLSTTLCSLTAHAQNFYLRFGGSYDFPLAAGFDGDGNHFNGSVNYLRMGDSVYQRDYSIKKASFAAGLHGDIAAGYMFNDRIGMELDVNLGIAPKKYSFVEGNYYYNGVPSTLTIEQKASIPVVLIPSVIMQTGGKTNFYTRLGLAIPVHSSIKEEEIVVNQPGTGTIETIDFTSVTKTSFTLGFSGAAGLKFELSKNMYFYTELNFLAMSLTAKENELEDVTVNGVSYLSYVSNRSVTYSKTASVNTNGSTHEAPAYSIPYSSLGVHVGLIFRVQKKMSSYQRYLLDKQHQGVK